ncbi:MAG TPA: IPT/TIG domain-containing protein, partial [Blastocatellia bacterium]|nr:IPT/TIG domain-containing protein [Blastocatellia bacterium]
MRHSVASPDAKFLTGMNAGVSFGKLMKNSLKYILVLVIICLANIAPGASFSSPQTPSPRIKSVSALTLARAERLRIFGENFGAIEAGSQVLIDGVPAPVSRWSDTLVVAYVPESVRIATVPVQIVT